ncbi:MAG: folylpolyglutamate synthase/dihydrofolate synthase family protein, partial [Candidatus Nanohaloarchaea archaeon]
MEQAYRSVVDSIYDLQRFRGSLSLDPVEDLMGELGHPEGEVPVVHVAGTNGKGSTATMLARVLEAAGYRTGLFTSPHLVDFRERIQVDGEHIPQEQVVERYRAVAEADVDASFFEAMTAMALDHFAQQDVDIAVVETGMGGRLDATNVVDPLLSVVTNVAREHTTVLGETPEQIAYEIAGVVKEAPVVSGATGRPGEVVAAVAAENGAPLHPVNDRVAVVDDDRMALTVAVDGRQVETGLVGRYQVDNIDTVLAAVDTLQ